jgi:hypothetical protein
MLLNVQEGMDAGRRLHLERGLLRIGRGADQGLVLRDAQASRAHAELRRFGDQWLLVDLGSTNGTFVEDPRGQGPPVRLVPQQAQPLRPGQAAIIGSTRLVLQEEPQDDPEWLASTEPAPSREAAPASLRWIVLSWLCRGLVLAGAALLILGTLRDWIRVQVSVPLLGTVVDRTLGGLDSGQGWLFIGVGAVAGVLVLIDIASRQWGLAAGLGQALVAALAGVSSALTVYQYYELGTQRILGLSLIDILTEYARDVVQLTMQPGIYWVAAGMAAIVSGGVLRLVVAGLEPAT